MRNLSSSILGAILVAAAALAQVPAAAPPAAEKPASLEGEVRNSITQAPIERAHVVLRRFTNGMWDRYGALTDADGKFVIPNVPPGIYMVAMDRTGYVDTTAAPANQRQFKAGEKDTAKLKLTPTGTITGRVLDADGAPMESLQVQAERGGNVQHIAMTDDRGMFRIGGLAPGKYRVLAQVRRMQLPPEIRTDGTAEINYSPTYYPGALDAKNASRVEVKAATDATGVEIRLVRTRIVRVSGKVTGAPPDAQNVSVMMQKAGTPGNNLGAVQRDGGFEIWRVDPGKYIMRANLYRQDGRLASGPVEIEVGDADVEGVAMTLMPLVQIQGKVEFEDEEARHPPQPPPARTTGGQASPPAPPPPPPQRFITLRDPVSNSTFQGPMSEDGAFTIKDIQPELYRVSIGGRAYVRAMQLGRTAVDGAMLDLRSGAAGPLTLRVASTAGAIGGMVRDDNGPVGGARIAVLDTSYDRPTPYFTMSKADGSYTVQNLAPGKYRVIGIDDEEMATVANLTKEEMADLGDEVEVRDRETVTKDLKKK